MEAEAITTPAPEAPPENVTPIDAERRAKEAERKRLARAKAKDLRKKELEPSPVAPAPAAIVKGPSPERVAKLAATLDAALKDSAETGLGVIDQLAKDNVTVPVDVARGACFVLSNDDARGKLSRAWAPLIAELAPDDGPPSPYVAAIIGTVGFALSVAATTFVIRKERADASAEKEAAKS